MSRSINPSKAGGLLMAKLAAQYFTRIYNSLLRLFVRSLGPSHHRPACDFEISWAFRPVGKPILWAFLPALGWVHPTIRLASLKIRRHPVVQLVILKIGGHSVL